MKLKIKIIHVQLAKYWFCFLYQIYYYGAQTKEKMKKLQQCSQFLDLHFSYKCTVFVSKSSTSKSWLDLDN